MLFLLSCLPSFRLRAFIRVPFRVNQSSVTSWGFKNHNLKLKLRIVLLSPSSAKKLSIRDTRWEQRSLKPKLNQNMALPACWGVGEHVCCSSVGTANLVWGANYCTLRNWESLYIILPYNAIPEKESEGPRETGSTKRSPVWWSECFNAWDSYQKALLLSLS